jgi:NitT/TauT family transport system substrate-binding protein
MKRSTASRLSFILAALLLAAALLGCDRKSAETKASEPPAVVRVGYFANLTHAQAVLGVASGDYARAVAPAKLETKVFNAGPSVIEALFAKEIDVAYVGPGPAISAHVKSRGQGVRVLAGAAANGVVIVVRKDSGIHALPELAGKRIGTPQLGNTQDISARHYFSSVLHETDLSHVVPVENAEQAGMFARGQLDAAWVPEPWGQRLVQESGASILAEEKDLWPDKEFVLTLVVTTPEFLAAHPDVIEHLLAAHRAWTRKLSEAPQSYVDQLGDALFALTSKRLPAGVIGPALGRVKFTDSPHQETLRAYATWMSDLGFQRAGVDVNDLFDTKILDKLRTQGP